MPETKAGNLHELFILKLQALYDMEQQLVKALPKMAKAATNKDLQKAFREHLEETEGQVERLEEIFELMDMKPKKLEGDAIRGLVADAEWCIKNIKDKKTLDASLIAAAQYVEHYEMAGYGSSAEWADIMGHEEAKKLLGETLEEEELADEKLSELATSKINEDANDMSEMEG